MIALFCAAFLWLAGSLVVAWRLSRRWSGRFEERVPAGIVAKAENVRLKTRDGEELGAWYLPGASASSPAVALFHGLGATRVSRLGAAQVFQQAGCAALLVTLRAHGDSTGEREDFGWDEQLDVIASVEWLEREHPGTPILVDGSSLGAAAATFAARELGTRVAAYVLECPYASLDRAAWHRAEHFFPPLVDWAVYGGVQLGAACFAPHWNESAPLEAVAAIPPSVPVLLLAGERDQRAPLEDVRAIASRVKSQVEVHVVPGADHDRLLSESGSVYAAAVLDWLGRLPSAAR